MDFRWMISEIGNTLWEKQDTIRYRRRKRRAEKQKMRTVSEPSALSTLVGDLTRPNTSLGDRLRIRRAAMPHRKAWKRYLRGQAQAERMWGPQSRMPTQPLNSTRK